MTEQSKGIVLHALRYNDTHLIVTVFTEKYGAVPFLLRDYAGNGKRRHASSWQALSEVEVVWDSQVNRSLQKPKEWILMHPWKSLPFHPVKATMCLFLGEFLHYALRNEHENRTLYVFLTEALQWFDASEDSFANFHVFLLLRMTTFLGFAPNVEAWKAGYFFDLRESVFTDKKPLHQQFLDPEEARLVPLFWRMKLKLLHEIQLNGNTRRRLLEVLTMYYEIHIPEFPSTNGLKIFAEMFQ